MRMLFVTLACLMLVGCSSYPRASHVTLGPPLDSVSSSHPIEVLADPPTKPYIKVAMVEVIGKKGSQGNNLTDVLIGEARKVGADAIMDLQMSTQSEEVLIGGFGSRRMVGGTIDRPRLTAIAIKYQE